MSRPKPQRQRFAVTLSQTVYHTVLVIAPNEDAAEAIAAKRYETDDRLFSCPPLPKGWRRYWSAFRVETVSPVTPPNRKDRS